MKLRRVILTIEVETDWNLKEMKDWVKQHFTDQVIEVVQIQANVIREKSKKRRKKL